MIIFQSGGIPDEETNKNLDTCKEISTGVFSIVPASMNLFIENEKWDGKPVPDAIPFGSVALLQIYYAGKLPANWKIFHDKTAFDFRTVQSKTNLFNNDFEVVKAKDIKTYKSDVFIRPLTDEKIINGFVLEKKTSFEKVIREKYHNVEKILEAELIVTPVKPTYLEIRFFVIRGKIISYSTYAYEKRVRTNIQLTAEELKKCYKIIDLYHPVESFVIDLHLDKRNDIVTVMEYNCLNCSAFYSADRLKIFERLYESMESQS